MQNETDGRRELPHNELFRVRTRTGHQILLHNTEDLIYISNSKGTAWLEMTSDGKIDIYAEDSISMYSGNDFNFTANRNVTIEAGANLYLKASDNHNASSKPGGKIQIESAADTNILITESYVGSCNIPFVPKELYDLCLNLEVRETKHLYLKQSKLRNLGFVRIRNLNKSIILEIIL